MSSSSTAIARARRLAFPAAARFPLAVAGVWLACAGCDIDDRTFENGKLTFSSRRELASADAGALGAADAGPPDTARADAGPRLPDPTAIDAERPIRALGDTLATGLLGGQTGRDERARCVEGVLVGLDYRFNDGTAQFPDRLTFVSPVCATPNVFGESLDLSEPASIAWSEVGGDGTEALRPEPTHRLLCPEGYAIVGLTGSMDELQTGPQIFAVRELEIDCAPLLVKPERVDIARGAIATVAAERVSPAPGALRVDIACDPGTTAATGAIVRWGSWLDGVGLQCSRLAWPFTTGHGCALDDDCQSGRCGSFATCAP